MTSPAQFRNGRVVLSVLRTVALLSSSSKWVGADAGEVRFGRAWLWMLASRYIVFGAD